MGTYPRTLPARPGRLGRTNQSTTAGAALNVLVDAGVKTAYVDIDQPGLAVPAPDVVVGYSETAAGSRTRSPRSRLAAPADGY